MGDDKFLMQALALAVTIILSLITALWVMVRAEQKTNTDALAQKASNEALKEVKSDLIRRMDEQRSDYDRKLVDQRSAHDKDIDRMREDLDRILTLVSEISKEMKIAHHDLMAEVQEIKVRLAASNK